MKAAVLYEIRQPLKIEELEMPQVSDEDILIKVACCGVCHTDLKVVEGRNRFTAPTVLGHEVAGNVERRGDARTLTKATGSLSACAISAAGAVTAGAPGKISVSGDPCRQF